MPKTADELAADGEVASDECYFFIFRPDMVRDLGLTPRERWRMEYRAERMRRKGIAPPELMLGSIEGIRFYA